MLKTFINKMRLKVSAMHEPRRIIVGAEGSTQNGWVSTEINVLNLLKDDDWKSCFTVNYIDNILAEHVWEHLTLEEGVIAASTCFKYLKFGGRLRAAVPDGFHPDKAYIEWVKPNGTGPASDDHKLLYTYRSFKGIFEQAGFQVKLLEYFDENGVFHFNEWSPDEGLIMRSKQFDKRNADGRLNYTSIILDAVKYNAIRPPI